MSTEPPFKLSESKRISIPLVLLLGLLGIVASGAITWANALGRIDGNKLQLSTHEVRIQKLEESQADLAVIRNNVDWIRRTLEGQDRAASRKE